MRKRRTRNHIIADLSANHVERHVLLCGYTVERVVHDYGIDLFLCTYTDSGEIENETVKIQLKATDRLSLVSDGQTIAFSLERADLEYWLEEWLPVILIVYDAQEDAAYWLYLQAHFQQLTGFDLTIIEETVTVHLSTRNVVNPDAILQFARFKARILQQFGSINHVT